MARPDRWIIFTLLVLAAAGCASTGPSDTDQLEAAQARWIQSGLSEHYQIELSRLCFCGFPGAFSHLGLEVVEGQIVRAWEVGSGNEVPRGFSSQFPTVTALFDLIAFEIAAKSDLIQVSYHPTHGAPMQIFIDRIRQAVDDEVSITIHLLENGVLDGTPLISR